MVLKEKDKTIVGYVLLIVGLLLMFYSILTVIGVFNEGNVPIEILKVEKGNETTKAETDPKSGNVTTPEIDLGQVIEPMFPMFNVLIWLAIAFFILIAGGRVARIGIQMMKASIPDVTIIKQDVKDIKSNYNPVEDVKPEKKEKRGFFKRKKKK
jgi:hypothetical protein